MGGLLPPEGGRTGPTLLVIGTLPPFVTIESGRMIFVSRPRGRAILHLLSGEYFTWLDVARLRLSVEKLDRDGLCARDPGPARARLRGHERSGFIELPGLFYKYCGRVRIGAEVGIAPIQTPRATRHRR